MFVARSVILAVVLFLTRSGPAAVVLPVAIPNDNRVAAGSLRDGRLSISLEATLTTWHPDGDSLPGLSIEAFAEAGKSPSAPGPLIRVSSGTMIDITLRNTLDADTLTFFLPSKLRGATEGSADSMVVLPGETRALRARATIPGSYIYYANGRSTLDRALRMRGFLVGALIVDSVAGGPATNERVLVLLDAVDSLSAMGTAEPRREVLAINGRSWPHTERFEATVGDTIRWRVLNASPMIHPMHLHGFYYRVDGFAGSGQTEASQSQNGRMVVTERMAPFTTMTVTWVPERAGNWLFHCHYQPHAGPHRPLSATLPDLRAQLRHENHAATGMGGMVVGVHVKPKPGQRIAQQQSSPRRRLRLVAVRDAGFPDSLPSMRFVLEEPSSGKRSDVGPGFSPTIEITRDEAVSITVVNQLDEPTAVHWHGIELESYFDGVAGFSGEGRRVTPIIAPGDSFEARFTPPRSGTFIYHSHVDEPRHHRAGLAGAIVVRDPGDTGGATEHLFFIKSWRATKASSPMEINGRVNPDTIRLRAGVTYRFRFVGLQVTSPNATVLLTARPDSSLANTPDSMLVRWRPLAKDGADLPDGHRSERLARQIVSIGETHDFEFRPSRRGHLRIEIRPVTAGRLFARVPILVE